MSSLHQHFRPDEKEFVDAVLEWKMNVENQYAPKRTDFLDPRQQHIMKSIIGQQEDILLSFFPEAGERKRALLYPSYFHPEEEDFGIKLFEIQYPSKFVTIEHRQVLGTLMSIGLKREKFGDIIAEDDAIQLMLAEEIADYVRMELTQIGRAKVSLKDLALNERLESQEQWQEKVTTVSSLRLDVVLASIYNDSRQKAQTLIKSSLVKVNWKTVESASFEVEEGDVISARGYGRSKLLSIEGRTKRDKWRISVGILK
ncbi:YlmH family RNA-binding protein [Bacillus sp. KH172YL63]|uniref:YlmH family RNA-binding protein n=1 Tax=Bacillus sp. KH172YL63 TaxID=2709784 RepID=UPI0013E5091B|nr:RNA-binding protein [Bacillus sp. KH172YL63]BCB03279.1 RNA-binding protein S4 [Bacillus sp. KH172YL63]